MTRSIFSAVRFFSNYLRLFQCLMVASIAACASLSMCAQSPTGITLAITSNNYAVTTVPQGTAVTLTATLAAGEAPGLIQFCDTDVLPCTDKHLLGTAQLVMPNYTTSFKFFPGVGTHHYTAIFVGTQTYAASKSGPQALAVTTSNPASITRSGQPGNYTLTATVAGGAPLPTGAVSFLDTTNGNASLGTATLSPNMANRTFNPYGTFSLGNRSESKSEVMGDFNGDGIPDLAIIENGGIGIFLGDGEGGFNSNTTVTTAGNTIWSIAAGDFDQDGRLDLVVTNYNPMTVTTLRGNGDGTFGNGVTVSLLGFAQQVVVGDFDGDGIPDIAVTVGADSLTTGVNGFGYIKGNGDGTFATPRYFSLYNSVDSLVLGLAKGEFNGDGLLDLAVSDDGGDLYVGNSFFSGGKGYPLNQYNEYKLNCGLSSIAVGDFNGDGKADLVAACGENTVRVLIGNGDGSFQSPATYTTGNDPVSVAVGDFDGDGKLDFVTANAIDNTVSVLLGNGDGTFRAGSTVPVGIRPQYVVAGDINGDGLPDLAVVNYGQDSDPDYGNSTVTILLNQTTATATLSGVSVPGSGSHVIDASYIGDSNYSAALSSNTVSLVGTQVATKLALSSSTSSATYGQQIALTAILSPYNSGNISTNTENVVFFSNGANIGTGSLSSGVAVLNVTSLPVGADTITAVYGGDDSFITSGSTAIAISVTQGPQKPALTWAAPTAIVYGTALSATQLNASASATGTPVAGTYTYAPAAGVVPNAGTVMLTVTFTPTDATKYSTQTASVPLIVNKATPVIAWTAPAPIIYGTALSTAQLNATSRVSGALAYMPAAGSIPGLGTQTLSVILTPNDTADYTTATATVPIVVVAATPTLTFAPIANQTTGAAPFTVSATSASPGAVTYAVTSGPATISGSTVTITGAGTVVLSATQAAAGNYTAATVSASFTVTAAPVLDFKMTSGQSQSQTIRAGEAVTYTLQIAPTSGTYPAAVTFTASGLPAGASFNFSPATLAANSGPATVNFTVKTTPELASSGGYAHAGNLDRKLATVALSLLLLPFAGLRKMRKNGGKAIHLLLGLLVMLGGVMTLTGCAGSPQIQSYSITIAATSGTMQHSSVVTLQVEK